MRIHQSSPIQMNTSIIAESGYFNTLIGIQFLGENGVHLVQLCYCPQQIKVGITVPHFLSVYTNVVLL